MARLMMISADGHVSPPLSDYREYLEAAYHDEFDRMIELLADESPRVTPSPALFDEDLIERHERLVLSNGSLQGEWDPSRRCVEMETQGVAAEILFPQPRTPFDPGVRGVALRLPDYNHEQQRAGCRAYNRWLADFVSAAPERFAGQAKIWMYDVKSAVQEVQWAKNHGLRGIAMPGLDPSIPYHWHPRYEPLWSACEDLEMPINFHAGAGAERGDTSLDIRNDVRAMVAEFEFNLAPRRPLSYLIFSGVLQRHPKLKVVFTEIHSDWVPSTISRFDWLWHSGKTPRSIREVCPLPPSEYWRRQCYVGASIVSRAEVVHRNTIGADHMMFGIDFPHVEGTYGRTLEYLRATVGTTDMGDAEIERFLGGTAAELFHFDVEKLRPVSERCGPTLEQIRRGIPLDELPSELLRTDVSRPDVIGGMPDLDTLPWT